MADPSEKNSDNVPGKYYVSTDCNACEVCADTAPSNFKMSDDGDHAYVYKQPENDDEASACEDAMDSCPDEAIGDDGA